MAVVRHVRHVAAGTKGPKGPCSFVCDTLYVERDIPKRAGFRWDPDLRLPGDLKPGHWWADQVEIAARLAAYCDESTAPFIEGVLADRLASRAATSDADLPRPAGLDYLPFQKAGIEYALRRENTLFGDEMGLGKTIQALGVINSTPNAKHVLVVCPASLKLNWRREANRWLIDRTFQIAVGSTKLLPRPVGFAPELLILNYESVVKHHEALQQIEWDIVIVDEAHYIKSATSQRSKAVRSLPAKRRLALTGTPIVNRPSELFTLLRWLDPGRWRSFKAYASRYCVTRRGRVVNGGRNLDELQDILRSSILVRRLKADVLTELPPKRRSILEFEPTAEQARAIREERNRWEELTGRSLDAGITDADLTAAFTRVGGGGTSGAFTELSRMRHELAVAKAPTVLAHVEALLEEVPKIILFAHHRDVLTLLHDGLREYGASVLTGDTPLEERQALVDSFQSDDSHRVFVASIQAAGVGLTLTAADTVVFAELDWVPGNLKQAEDRAHRIGSERHESISCQYVVLEGSLDGYIAALVAEKIATIEQALDAQKPEPKPVELPPVIGSLAQKPEPQPRDFNYDELPGGKAQATAVLYCCQLLAGHDLDRASVVNDIGFNKLDNGFGHSLAGRQELTPRQAIAGARMLQKYKRQLPAVFYELAVYGRKEGVLTL